MVDPLVLWALDEMYFHQVFAVDGCLAALENHETTPEESLSPALHLRSLRVSLLAFLWVTDCVSLVA